MRRPPRRRSSPQKHRGFPGPTEVQVSPKARSSSTAEGQGHRPRAGDGSIAVNTANYICAAKAQGTRTTRLAFVTASSAPRRRLALRSLTRAGQRPTPRSISMSPTRHTASRRRCRDERGKRRRAAWCQLGADRILVVAAGRVIGGLVHPCRAGAQADSDPPGPEQPASQPASCPDVQVVAIPGTWESSAADDP